MYNELLKAVSKVYDSNSKTAENAFSYSVARAQGRAEIARDMMVILNAVIDGADSDTVLNMLDRMVDVAHWATQPPPN